MNKQDKNTLNKILNSNLPDIDKLSRINIIINGKPNTCRVCGDELIFEGKTLCMDCFNDWQDGKIKVVFNK